MEKPVRYWYRVQYENIHGSIRSTSVLAANEQEAKCAVIGAPVFGVKKIISVKQS